MASSLESLDKQVSAILSDWSVTTTAIALLLVALLVYPLIYPDEPDTHPLLLARQASASAVRNKGESAIYRSPETPHGYPLRSGLNVKDPGSPRWASGRDGDLRDVWREVQRGGTSGKDGKEIPKGLILSVFGKQEVVEHDITALSKEIEIIGKQFKDAGVQRVAIYLPNCVEYLETLFACAFFGLTPVLMPFNLPHPKLYELLQSTQADGLVAQAGSIPSEDLAKQVPSLKLLTWVVEKTSRHMDWTGGSGRLSAGAWHDVVEKNESDASVELPSNELYTPGDIITVWQPTDVSLKPEIVALTQGNMAAATGALISAIPLRQRYSSADLVLPADTFSHNYVLCQTLAALMTHASIAINSVAVPGVDLNLARRGVAPTVIIASAETLAKLHQQETAGISTGLQRLGKYTQDQTVSAGRMPTDGILFRLLAPSSSKIDPGKLRLILTSERLGAGSPALTSTMLSDLRIFTRSRIVYALTAAKVAGAVAQTNVFDYRRYDGRQHSHFGIPPSSVEFMLLSPGTDADVGGEQPVGEILVGGPAVVEGKARLGVKGRVREDCTLAYA